MVFVASKGGEARGVGGKTSGGSWMMGFSVGHLGQATEGGNERGGRCNR